MKVGGEIFLLFNAFDKFNSNVKKWLQFKKKKKKKLESLYIKRIQKVNYCFFHFC